jgi:hypothetical protein
MHAVVVVVDQLVAGRGWQGWLSWLSRLSRLSWWVAQCRGLRSRSHELDAGQADVAQLYFLQGQLLPAPYGALALPLVLAKA